MLLLIYRPWMLCQVEIIATAAKWGLSGCHADHGTFDLSHMATRQLKLPADLWNGNIGEDRVPIVLQQVEMDLSEAACVVLT